MEPSLETTHAVLQQIGNFVKNLTPQEAADLAAGRMRITLSTRGRPAKPETGRSSVPDPAEVRAALADKASREDGHAYLEELHLTRVGLQHLARAMDLPLNRTDRVDRIKERIIEATIGYRLRSDAIQGDPAEGEAKAEGESAET
ncbi:hypothetical protein ABT144_22045 [Streptomyces sp. NPDC002039]|uniref:hypothetical protein n=1 Tax=Streptomyces sp. NPDC002039 TaxID=3154660 RepID=UPI00332EE17D